RGDHRVHGWEYLSMRDLSADHRRHPQGRAGGEGGAAMNQPRSLTTGDEIGIEIEPERYELREGLAYRFDLDRRGFLKARGGGILVLSLLEEGAAAAQPPGGGRRRGGGGGPPLPQDIGAWLHIGEDGRITVYTGKAEVGQNIRTSLTQAVAEEL